ncbi:hypothetical protein B0H12DRAFT_1242703 [Mycena haematopus]|nr:hypothetical protein B0H12DRAFT_1242703 [Mycena haematopus]
MPGVTLTKRRVSRGLTIPSTYSRFVRISCTTRRAANGRSLRTKTVRLTFAQARLLQEAEETERSQRRAALIEQQRWEKQDALRVRTSADISHSGEAVDDDAVEDVQQTLLEEIARPPQQASGPPEA